MNRRIVASLLVVAAVVCGCRKPEQISEGSTPETAIEEIRALVAAGYETGAWEPALTRLELAFEDEALAAHRNDIFRDLLSTHLAMGETNKAVALHVAQLADEALCPVGCTVIGPALASVPDRTAFLAWCETLTASASVPWVRQRAWGSLLEDASGKGTLAAFVQARLSDILKDEPKVQEQVAVVATRLLLEADSLDAVDALIETLEGVDPELPWVALYATRVRLDLLLERGDWAAAQVLLFDSGMALDDRDLWSRLRKVLIAASGDEVELDQVVARANEVFAGRGSLLGRIAGVWVDAAVKSDNMDRYISCCQSVVSNSAIAPRVRYQTFQRGFYKLMSGASIEQRLSVQAIADSLALLELSDMEEQALALLRLDAAFYLDDWRGALAVLDAGIPGRDEAWHDQLKNKVSAHLALSEKRFEDAIAGFRRYMASVRGWDEQQANPETGALTSQDVVLGFNAKRIGDIYGQMGEHAEKQQAAYLEARKYYAAALEAAEEGSKTYEEIKAEMVQVP